MVLERDLDLLIEKMSGDHNKDTSFIENYSRVHTRRNVEPRVQIRIPEDEIQQRNKEAWYAAGKQKSTLRSQTPILKKRFNSASPTSDYSDNTYQNKSLNTSNKTPVSGYESDTSFSPRFRSVSPYRKEKSVVIGPVTEIVTKQDYYRHKDAHHKKPLPGYNQYMGSSLPYGLDERENTSPRRSPIPTLVNNSRRSLSPYDLENNRNYYNQQNSGSSNNYENNFDDQNRKNNYEKENNENQDENNLKRSLSKENLAPCQDIDGKGRFTNLPSNWEKSLTFFEEKREQVPVQHIKKVEPLNKYVKPERIRMTESTPNLLSDLTEKAKLSQNQIPAWMKDLKHIVIEQVPVPVPPRFGTLLHGRRNPDWSLAPLLDGPLCQLCHTTINESRCIRSEQNSFHCWHFVCSFCFKTLRELDFTMAPDNKPYCMNCFKRSFP